ncbi:MAG: hypothetical protein ACYC6C_00400 [Coriobacteriia bacterium]
MGFFLVGRTSSGELALISPEVFGSRQEALNALTTISADPAFAHRESEVFVGDLDQATPILLVASAAPAVGAADLKSDAAQEPDTAGEPEPVDETLSDAGVWEAPEQEAEEGEGLAGALKRATGALESEGIVAPDSIGPEPHEPEPESEGEPESAGPAAAEIAWPWDAGTTAAEHEFAAGSDLEPEQKGESSEEPEPEQKGESSEEPEAESEPEPEPEAEPEPESAMPEDEPEPEAEPEPEPESAIPEDEPVQERAVYVPDPFEEPAVDGDDIVSLRADDETVALGRPVVMGAYSEDAPEVVEPASVAGPDAGTQDVGEAVGPEADSDALDGILADLEPITEAPAGYAGSDSEEALTCADCVYEQTCPNKEGLDPSQCGNFQWKAH